MCSVFLPTEVALIILDMYWWLGQRMSPRASPREDDMLHGLTV